MSYWSRIAAARSEVRAVEEAMVAEDWRRAWVGEAFVEDERFWELNERSERADAALRAAWLGREAPTISEAVRGAGEAVRDAVARAQGERARGHEPLAGEAGDGRGDGAGWGV